MREMSPVRSVCHLFLFLRNARNVARQVSVSSVLIPKKCAKCRPSGHFVVFAYFNKNARMPPFRWVCRFCLFLRNARNVARQVGLHSFFILRTAWNAASPVKLSSLFISKKCRQSCQFVAFAVFSVQIPLCFSHNCIRRLSTPTWRPCRTNGRGCSNSLFA